MPGPTPLSVVTHNKSQEKFLTHIRSKSNALDKICEQVTASCIIQVGVIVCYLPGIYVVVALMCIHRRNLVRGHKTGFSNTLE